MWYPASLSGITILGSRRTPKAATTSGNRGTATAKTGLRIVTILTSAKYRDDQLMLGHPVRVPASRALRGSPFWRRVQLQGLRKPLKTVQFHLFFHRSDLVPAPGKNFPPWTVEGVYWVAIEFQFSNWWFSQAIPDTALDFCDRKESRFFGILENKQELFKTQRELFE